MTEVSIDTASEVAGVALSEGGALLAEVTWRTHQNQSRELLPTLDWLLKSRERSKESIGALFVCLGPGSYAGLRIGISTAKTIAYALQVPLVGVGRLPAEASAFALAGGHRVMAVHAAGRAELAFAAYERANDDELREVLPPALGRADRLSAALRPGDVLTGELSPELRAELDAPDVLFAPPVASRVAAIAALGHARLLRGEVDDVDKLVPLYLREPAIGPQPPR